jgi:hypothetical protein
MKDESTKIILIYDRKVLFRETLRGWAIVVIPEGIMFDNFYHGVHIHLNGEDSSIEKDKREQITIKDPNIIHEKICRHLKLERKIILSKLLKELK